MITVTVQLVNGGDPSHGRVQITRNGQVGTVCDNGWDNNEGRVICQALGYP